MKNKEKTSAESRKHFIQILQDGLNLSCLSLTAETASEFQTELVKYLEENIQDKRFYPYKEDEYVRFDYNFLPGDMYLKILPDTLTFHPSDKELYNYKHSGEFVVKSLRFVFEKMDAIEE